MNTTPLTLLQRVRQTDDHAAWDQFVALYSPLLFAFAQRTGINDDHAADIVQEVFVVLMTEMPNFEYDASRKNFRGWLKAITVNKCRERQRHTLPLLPNGGSNGCLAAAVDEATVEAFWEVEFRQQLVAQALRLMRTEFEPPTWQAAWLALTTDQSAAEIAQAVGLAEASVWVAKSRVLRRLREELGDQLA